MAEQLFRFGQLHQLALINHCNSIADKTHDGQVMGNKQIGQPMFLLQLGQEIKPLRPDGHIQSGNGLVRHDEFRLHNQRPGNADALTLTAGKFMGKPGGKLRQQSHIQQDLINPRLALLLGQMALHIVKPLAYNIIHLGPLIQRSHGILKNHLNFPGHFPVQCLADPTVNFLALKKYFAAGCFINADDGPADGGFAGTGFPHQPEGFAGINIKAHAAHRIKRMPAGTKGHLHIPHRQQRFSVLAHSFSPPFCSRLRISGFSTWGARGSSSQVRALWVGDTSKKGGRCSKSIFSA